MKLKLASYELSMKAKDKGFDWETLNYYASNREIYEFPYYEWNRTNDEKDGYVVKDFYCCAPTLELLSKWFRDVHNIILSVYYEPENVDNMAYAYCIQIRKADDSLPCYGDKPTSYSWNMNTGYWRVYEEALSNGLFKAMELI